MRLTCLLMRPSCSIQLCTTQTPKVKLWV
ncbi:hypothetical protein PHET_09537 [Paragonimus heterotremus]|uniref:Uncharacterized protein n=1 Tax=Paragonimus heterotremus TaxID=100268 RepID=A0A8J4T432_9TREM|nr:hypothetical protein PHET_09537 [Paragonimus heterotremus]